MKRHLIEVAYEYAKINFNKSPFSFKELFDALLKNDKSIENSASDLYIDLLQDIRFISLGKQKWSLRENFTLSEINKITSSMFGLEEYHEEDADKYMSDTEKKEQISKQENNEDFSDFIDNEDDDRNSGSSSDKVDSSDSINKNDSFDDEDDDVDDYDEIEINDDEEEIDELK